MNCYYHPNVQSVGICKNCQKGLCVECAVDVGNGLACKNQCETAVLEINDIFQRTRNQYYRLGSMYMRNIWAAAFLGVSLCFVGVLLMISNPRYWLAALPLVVISLFGFASAINSYRESKKHPKPTL
jgi:hypothetical protein